MTIEMEDRNEAENEKLNGDNTDDSSEIRLYNELHYEFQVQQEIHMLHRALDAPVQMKNDGVIASAMLPNVDEQPARDVGSSLTREKRSGSVGNLPGSAQSCHLCGRTANRVKLFTCRNYHIDGSCKKSICLKCFENPEYGEILMNPRDDFECTHCT
eukprot:CAMPEP_0182449680 /NCGR_PEP_ID=MMETSP1172-20130603/36014_1 /TAXON_ID=708627 /ORGANISM="Timspurckia oligopyrenoides, Strain CCMP3278" /LENGTH=156 /DNA_ID=CAMNT_0024647025 /DNA_START=119 /DNA_END=586 /DNA_ORIENTATION=-